YTPAGGRVAITATREVREGETMLRVVWQDTGIGIAEEEVPHVWDDFYRAPDERVRRRSGTGLGLPIVARLVEGMGGQITLTSVPDAGTRVTLELPLRP